MDRAIVVSQQGGPEVLEWTQKDPGEPGPGEVLVRHTAVGHSSHRAGLWDRWWGAPITWRGGAGLSSPRFRPRTITRRANASSERSHRW